MQLVKSHVEVVRNNSDHICNTVWIQKLQSSENVLKLAPVPRYQIATIHLPSHMTERKHGHICYTAVSHTQADTHQGCGLIWLLLIKFFFELATQALMTATVTFFAEFLRIKLGLLKPQQRKICR